MFGIDADMKRLLAYEDPSMATAADSHSLRRNVLLFEDQRMGRHGQVVRRCAELEIYSSFVPRQVYGLRFEGSGKHE